VYTTEIIIVPSITVICYLFSMSIKKTKMDTKWIPIFSATLGGILGLVGMYVITNFPASDPLTAIAQGIFSGLAATGANQVKKILDSKIK